MKCAKCGKEITEREAYLHIIPPDFSEKVCFECLGEVMKDEIKNHIDR